jgi:hypothetical protein
MYLEVLNLLHSQVSSTTAEDLATDYKKKKIKVDRFQLI